VDFDPATSRIIPLDLRKNVGISVVAITLIGLFMLSNQNYKCVDW
jgi:hypothetical protein